MLAAHRNVNWHDTSLQHPFQPNRFFRFSAGNHFSYSLKIYQIRRLWVFLGKVRTCRSSFFTVGHIYSLLSRDANSTAITSAGKHSVAVVTGHCSRCACTVYTVFAKSTLTASPTPCMVACTLYMNWLYPCTGTLYITTVLNVSCEVGLCHVCAWHSRSTYTAVPHKILDSTLAGNNGAVEWHYLYDHSGPVPALNAFSFRFWCYPQLLCLICTYFSALSVTITHVFAHLIKPSFLFSFFLAWM